MGGYVQDPRLDRSRELPNLRCVVFLRVDDPAPFLEHLRGLTIADAEQDPESLKKSLREALPGCNGSVHSSY